jgi:hypothetical protein
MDKGAPHNIAMSSMQLPGASYLSCSGAVMRPIVQGSPSILSLFIVLHKHHGRHKDRGCAFVELAGISAVHVQLLNPCRSVCVSPSLLQHIQVR